MIKKVLFFVFILSSLNALCQYELDAAESCKIKIEKKLGEVLIAYGSPECTIFTIDTLHTDTLLTDYTLLVFDKKSKSDLLYQVTVISGVKEGLEIFFIANEKVIVHYIEGKRTGKSKTFYYSGVVRFEREFKNDVLKPKVKEFDEKGNLLRKIKIK